MFQKDVAVLRRRRSTEKRSENWARFKMWFLLRILCQDFLIAAKLKRDVNELLTFPTPAAARESDAGRGPSASCVVKPSAQTS